MAIFKDKETGQKVIDFKAKNSSSVCITKPSIKFLNELDYVLYSVSLPFLKRCFLIWANRVLMMF